jgi:hypothetical protein
MRIILFLLLQIPCLSIAFSQSSTQTDSGEYQPYLYHTEHFKVQSYLEMLRLDTSNHVSGNILIITDHFPTHFVKTKEIDSLLTLVKSKQKCRCVLNPLSSYIPLNKTAELGGYVIALINSYKINKPYSIGLYSCPQVDDKEADDLIHWWESKNKHTP